MILFAKWLKVDIFQQLELSKQEVKGHREEISAGESRLAYLNAMKKILENQNQRISDEMKSYMSTANKSNSMCISGCCWNVLFSTFIKNLSKRNFI